MEITTSTSSSSGTWEESLLVQLKNYFDYPEMDQQNKWEQDLQMFLISNLACRC